MCFVLKDIFKEGSGAMRYFHLFWHASTSNWKFCLGFTRQTMAYWCYWYWPQEDFESRPVALTICMVSWLCMNGLDMECGRGILVTRPNAKTRHSFTTATDWKKSAILSKFRCNEGEFIIQRLLLQSISAASDLWTTTVLLCPPIHILCLMYA